MQQRSPLTILLGVLLLSVACQAQEKHAPAPSKSAPKPAPLAAAPPPAAATQPSVMHTVSEGETLHDIAHSYGVSVKKLMLANEFDSDDIRRLHKGAQIEVPGASAVVDVQTRSDRAAQREALPALSDGAYHFLHRGETLQELARLYDKPLDDIMERNGLSEDVFSRLRIGQAIIIPGIKASQVKQVDENAPRRGGFVYEISRGETLWDVAHTFQVTVAEIMAANGLSEDEAKNVRDGKRVFLPGVEDDGRGHVTRKATASEKRAEINARRLGLGSLRVAALLLHGHVEPRWIRAAGGGKTLPGTLLWPVREGWFVRGYGSGQGGYHKAMDIMAKMGRNVRAAAPGVVGYSGDKVPGFGNMVMVVHPGGWVTLYAHNSVNIVAAGQQVKKGEILAEIGSTGRSMGPHSHFELIYDGKNCDPAPLFRPGVQRRDRKFSRLKQTTWRIAGKRPEAVACAKRQKHPLGQSIESEVPEPDAKDPVNNDASATTEAQAE